tara:strand:+ start:3022 stop:3312 length:291 start_codon:yes stop_codon:yes gene_type:complete
MNARQSAEAAQNAILNIEDPTLFNVAQEALQKKNPKSVLQKAMESLETLKKTECEERRNDSDDEDEEPPPLPVKLDPQSCAVNEDSEEEEAPPDPV